MELIEFFKTYPNAAIAFSGGVDSSYLLYAGMKYGKKIRPYIVKTQFQPDFELNDARRFAAGLGAELTVISCDILSHGEVTENPTNRCYYCKKALFGLLKERAAADGFSVLLDGTNASDDAADRPGMRALCELGVLSPLRECGLTKKEIRRRSEEAGLFTWDKPAYACLATRIPDGTAITADLLDRTEHAEGFLFSLGFSDFRVRFFHGVARLQLPEKQMERAVRMKNEIRAGLSPYFDTVLLDLKER